MFASYSFQLFQHFLHSSCSHTHTHIHSAQNEMGYEEKCWCLYVYRNRLLTFTSLCLFRPLLRNCMAAVVMLITSLLFIVISISTERFAIPLNWITLFPCYFNRSIRRFLNSACSPISFGSCSSDVFQHFSTFNEKRKEMTDACWSWWRHINRVYRRITIFIQNKQVSLRASFNINRIG